MCSGCSGNYADDFADPEGNETGDGPELREERAAASEARAMRVRSERDGDYGGGEDTGSDSDYGGGHDTGGDDGDGRDDGAVLNPADVDGWEVLVSAQHIVEIRFLPPPELPAPPQAGTPPGAARARYYRTPFEAHPPRPRAPRIAMLCIALGAMAWALLALWLLVG